MKDEKWVTWEELKGLLGIRDFEVYEYLKAGLQAHWRDGPRIVDEDTLPKGRRFTEEEILHRLKHLPTVTPVSIDHQPPLVPFAATTSITLTTNQPMSPDLLDAIKKYNAGQIDINSLPEPTRKKLKAMVERREQWQEQLKARAREEYLRQPLEILEHPTDGLARSFKLPAHDTEKAEKMIEEARTFFLFLRSDVDAFVSHHGLLCPLPEAVQGQLKKSLRMRSRRATTSEKADS